MKCTHCRIGRYQETQLPFMAFLDEQPLVVPNVAALRCDMCGEVLFDEAFLDKLQYLLDQLAEPIYPPETAEWLALNEQLVNWQSSGRMC
jgi:hypothetical protein